MYQVRKDGNRVIYTDDEENREVSLDEKYFMGMFLAANPKALDTDEIRDAVKNPVKEGERLASIVRKKQGRTAAIVISDATRGVPTKTAAAYLLEELEEGGIERKDVVLSWHWAYIEKQQKKK